MGIGDGFQMIQLLTVRSLELQRQSKDLADLRKETEQALPHLDMTQMCIFAWAAAALERSGRKEYEISAGLAERLFNTELRGVKQLDIETPFEAIVLHLPAGLAIKCSKDHLLPQSIIIYNDRSWLAEQGLRRLIISWLSGKGEDVSVSSTVILLFNDNISDLKLNLSDREGVSGISQEQRKMLEEIHPRLDQETLDFHAWIVNVLLYITTSSVRTITAATNREWQALTDRIDKLPAGPKKERLKQRRRSLDPNYRIYLGADVPPLGNAREGSSLTVRTLVQGHWRNQVCGPQWQERKLIWIQPFWRGPEFAEATNPIRVLP